MTLLQVIIILAIALSFVVFMFLGLQRHEPKTYAGKAKLIARFTDKEGCFICEFEKDGKIVNAVYGFDSPSLKVGDEVEIVWNGKLYSLPHVMDKQVYDREQAIHINLHNQEHGEF